MSTAGLTAADLPTKLWHTLWLTPFHERLTAPRALHCLARVIQRWFGGTICGHRADMSHTSTVRGGSRISPKTAPDLLLCLCSGGRI